MSERPQWIRDLISDARKAYIEWWLARGVVSEADDIQLGELFHEAAQKVADALDTTLDQAKKEILCLN